MAQRLPEEQNRVLALDDEGVESCRLDPNRDQLLVTEDDTARRFRHRRNTDGDPFPRLACRASVACDLGAFGHGLTHSQQSHGVLQRLRYPGSFLNSE